MKVQKTTNPDGSETVVLTYSTDERRRIDKFNREQGSGYVVDWDRSTIIFDTPPKGPRKPK